jgi:hypothetical protein
MEDPSTIRSAVVGAAIGGAPYDGDSLAGQTVANKGPATLSGHQLDLMEHRTSFVLRSQYVLFFRL